MVSTREVLAEYMGIAGQDARRTVLGNMIETTAIELPKRLFFYLKKFDRETCAGRVNDLTVVACYARGEFNFMVCSEGEHILFGVRRIPGDERPAWLLGIETSCEDAAQSLLTRFVAYAELLPLLFDDARQQDIVEDLMAGCSSVARAEFETQIAEPVYTPLSG